MPELVNKTDQPIQAATGHTVPPHGRLAVSDDTLGRVSTEPYIAMKLRKGDLSVEYPQPEPGPITRATIARANRGELVEIITGHSDYAEDDLEGITVEGREGEDGLRDMAVQLVFGD